MNQSELIFQPSEQKVANPAPEKRKLVQQFKPKMQQGQDGRFIGPIPRTPEEIERSFWNRVDKKGPDDCWEWKGGCRDKVPHNYGTVWFNGKQWRAHVFAYTIHHGPTNGLFVCHKCDNPPCCNPNHLFLGTNLDNVRDMISKGRDKREKGEERYNARLTEDDVREIRRRHKKRDKVNGQTALAKEFGVYHTMIHAIVTGRRWKHVT